MLDIKKKRRLIRDDVLNRIPKWNETKKRYGIAVSELYNTGFAAFSWTRLKNLFIACGIEYSSERKEGSSILLHDGEIRNRGLMVAVSPSMVTTISMMCDKLTILEKTLIKSVKKVETNISDINDFFMKLSLDYQNLATDKCV